MKTSLAACLIAVIAFAPLAAQAQTAPAKSERAMPEGSNIKAMKNKAPKSERAMTSTAKTKKAKSHGSERAMPTQK